MAKIVLDMSMSLDGFIAGPEDNAPHGLGLNGERLHNWFPYSGRGLPGRLTGAWLTPHRREDRSARR
jgi:hypothetical protein